MKTSANEAKHAFRCKLCGSDFPVDGKGFAEIWNHSHSQHNCSPTQSCVGIVDVDTGKILSNSGPNHYGIGTGSILTGWGPGLLAVYRRMQRDQGVGNLG